MICHNCKNKSAKNEKKSKLQIQRKCLDNSRAFRTGEGYAAVSVKYTWLVKIMLTLQIQLAGYFQQDGAPPHFALTVRAYLDHTFPCRWIGRSGPLPWPSHSPDLTPCVFWLWGMVKERVYNRKIRDINDLKDRIRTVVSSIPREMCVRALNGTVVAGYFVLNMTANRLRPSRKSSCTYHICFVNKWFLQFKC